MPPKRMRRDAAASPDVLSFTNRLTARHVSLALVVDGTLQSSEELCAQIKHPLKLIQAAAWFFAMKYFLPGMKPHWEEHPLRHRVWEPGTQFPPSVLVLLMCGWATASRLATAPAGVYVIRKTMVRWASCIMERVLRGRVRRVQVRLQRRASCAVSCSYRASAYVRFVSDACCSKHGLIFRYVALHRSGCMKRAAAFIIVYRLLLPPEWQAVPTFGARQETETAFRCFAM
jgi:hypothetical protein